MFNISVHEQSENSASHLQLLQGGGALEPGFEPKNNNGQDSHVKRCEQTNVFDRLSRVGVRAFSSAYASARRSRLQRQPEVCETSSSEPQRLLVDAPDRASITPAMRKRYLKELLLSNSSGGFASVVSSNGSCASPGDFYEEDEVLVLSPMEHEWMLDVVDGNYETIIKYLSEDSSLLTRKDFVSGFTVLHWLAKNGRDEILLKLLRHAEKEGIFVDVNLKGSGGLTPLHVAAIHSQFMVIKILVGAFGAKIDAMDYSGRRAWQYLKGNAPKEMRELLGTWDDEHFSVGHLNTNNNRTCSSTVSKSESIVDERDQPVYCDRTWRNGSWRGSLKNLWSPFLTLLNKS
ncbi:ankyrin repeat domain-containing protein SOWAHD [Esox lucius]|uniref:Uncharacterized protein n=1 Tax=Esox lucius TaxID=8010 RepID=A0A3P9AHA7_ESOLU|nr:ankyrin repeat domain-containing protein SOWAHD [Esox lucius]XP_010894494.1 ankyrin repeat domain-containing protein SOWAHD [Esox lucius]